MILGVAREFILENHGVELVYVQNHGPLRLGVPVNDFLEQIAFVNDLLVDDFIECRRPTDLTPSR